MKPWTTLLLTTSLVLWLTACGGENGDGTHTHADGTTHSNDHTDNSDSAGDDEGDHGHGEVAIGTFTIGGIEVEAAQGHGAVEPAKESHLVIKLGSSDRGQTIVRAWIGTEDRFAETASTVTKATYAASHDDYDVHVVAPDPLPQGAEWWIEIEEPDGTKSVGSFRFLTEDDLGG